MCYCNIPDSNTLFCSLTHWLILIHLSEILCVHSYRRLCTDLLQTYPSQEFCVHSYVGSCTELFYFTSQIFRVHSYTGLFTDLLSTYLSQILCLHSYIWLCTDLFELTFFKYSVSTHTFRYAPNWFNLTFFNSPCPLIHLVMHCFIWTHLSQIFCFCSYWDYFNILLSNIPLICWLFQHIWLKYSTLFTRTLTFWHTWLKCTGIHPFTGLF